MTEEEVRTYAAEWPLDGTLLATLSLGMAGPIEQLAAANWIQRLHSQIGKQDRAVAIVTDIQDLVRRLLP